VANDAFLVLGVEQSALAFCDIQCFNVFSVYQDCSAMLEAKTLKKVKMACYYCAACGKSITKAKNCILHEEGCPPFVWFAAYPLVRDFIDEWISQFGDDDINAVAWQVADEIAARNPIISGYDLCLLTIKNLGY
jgi:hypothetical protein